MNEEIRLCRACLTSKVKLNYLYENGLNICYTEILGFAIQQGNQMPPYLCSFCTHLVKKFKLFQQQCYNAESILKKVLVRNAVFTEDLAVRSRKNFLNLQTSAVETHSCMPNRLPLKSSLIFHVDVPDTQNDTNVHNFEHIVVNELTDIQTDIKKEAEVVSTSNAENYDLITNVKVENLNFDDDGFDDYNDDMTLDQILKGEQNFREEKVGEESFRDERKLRKRKERKVKKEKVVKSKKGVKRSKRKAPKVDEIKDDDEEVGVMEDGDDEVNSEKYRNAKLFYNYNPQHKLTKENLQKRVEMLDKFLTKYNVEVKFLSKEEQIAEVRRRSQYYRHLPFRCTLCNRGYSVEESYKIHMTSHDPSSGDYECEVCGIRSRTRQDRRKHINAAHLKRFTCKICGKVTKSQSYAKAHYAQHGGTTYSCDQCDKKFTKKSNFLGHMRRVHCANATDCPICSDSFVGQFGLNLHMAMKHKQAVKCPSCNLLFDNAAVLSRHTENSVDGVCEPNIRACMRCGEGFPNEESYESHVREHHKKRRVSCEACDKTFSAEHNLSLHWSKAHSGVPRPRAKPRALRGEAPRDANKQVLYMCDQCGKSFNIRTHFTLHMRLHTGEKPHQCPMCPKTFRLPLALKMHTLTHTDERPYRCAACPRAFRQSAHLHTHMRTHTLEKPHVCPVCHKAFSQVANMREHARTVHEGLPPRRRRRQATQVAS